MEIMNMKLKMMATLWDNTYRVAIDDGQGKYIGTARVVVNVPLPPEMLPENAPQVEPQLLVLVEDFGFRADKIINFETTLSDLLREKFRYEIPHIFFYYPSPSRCFKSNNFHNKVYNEQKLCKIHSFFCLFRLQLPLLRDT